MLAYLPQILVVVGIVVLIVLILRFFPSNDSDKGLMPKLKTKEKKKQKITSKEKGYDWDALEGKKDSSKKKEKKSSKKSKKEEKKDSSKKTKTARKNLVDEELKKVGAEDSVDEQRELSLRTKREMHENVLKVIDRLTYIGKRIGGYAKAGFAKSAQGFRIAKAKIRKRGKQGAVSEDTVIDLLEKAALMVGKGSFDEAEKSYIDIIKLNPRNVRAYRGLGLLYEKQKNYEDAIASFEQILKLDPLDDSVSEKLKELRKLRREHSSKKKKK